MNYLVSFVSLGCDKNLVDSEHMLGLLNQGGFSLTGDEEKADVIVVNTCCFIEDAKKESIENILEVAGYKETGNCKALIVTGCMAQRYKQEILDEIPEVDAVVGTTSYDKIVDIANGILEQKGLRTQHFDLIDREMLDEMPRILTTAGYFAYVKISEGCDKHCTYCIIPKLRGKYRSRQMDKIKAEVEKLAADGVSEIILVAQDTTEYGRDLENASLAKLLHELGEIEGIEWIRVLYCYPESITDELIEEIKTNPKVCKYLDIPIQHASTAILKRMARKSSLEQLKERLGKLRQEIPGIALRTTLIVGFPGETEEDFQILYDFVKEMRFDRLGVFTYSKEEGTPAALFEDQIDEKTKIKRRDAIMALQHGISSALTAEKVGKTMKVLIEGKITDEDVYIGRTYQDAPDIDGEVFVEYEGELISGDFVDVRITASNDYDLIGEIVDEYSE
ncbi:30S ribosomal protein S12 methylthiotransferase RimO [Cellulosilyticum lentocellum]|uniref:Ribosomal protein uS12 methylthiotransferase RimO n=1 Tax=Cellulosilyticum lentocellum (strain ATCC 49066 / DSM 5427 / NCIMB 11756 / RHM5) TaxID=642492 RepID=F2JR15_CELLD|nr:30S ribosomal protein S12 methylthiotransferase RimO [Cellulosilyticum lentocellum]ADZ83873.1 Ribosomal protein S12 methylthiotransferase rimO [Cellulosilyticum lentocellum DSM 5427]